MEPMDLTVEILRGIRDEARATNARLDETNARLDALTVEVGFAQTPERLDRVERRQTEAEIRWATEVVGVAAAVKEVRDLLRDERWLKKRADDHEARLEALEKRAT